MTEELFSLEVLNSPLTKGPKKPATGSEDQNIYQSACVNEIETLRRGFVCVLLAVGKGKSTHYAACRLPDGKCPAGGPIKHVKVDYTLPIERKWEIKKRIKLK